MKTPSIALFTLIKKMSPSEKRYFKRFGLLQQKRDSSKYTLLFDAINAMEEYHEEKIIDQFKDYDFVNNFSEIKKYLFQQIQKALRNYHAQNTIDIVLYNYLTDISILYSKEMYSDCEKLIRKAKKLALKHEKWTILLSLNEWKRNVYRLSHDVKGVENYMKNEIQNDKVYIENLVIEQQYFNHSLEKVIHLRKNGPNTAFNERILPPQNEPFTFRSKRYAFLNDSMLAYMNTNTDQLFASSREDVAIFENNPHFIDAMPKQYMIALANIQDACKVYKYNQYFDEYFDKAQKILDKYTFDPEFKVKETLFSLSMKCLIYSQRNDIISLKNIRKELKKHIAMADKLGYLTDDLSFYAHFYLLKTAIILEDYSEALLFYNTCLQLNIGNYRPDLQMETRILGLIPHFENQNFILLESLIRSISRYLNTKFRHMTIGMDLIDLIKRCINLKNHRMCDEETLQHAFSEFYHNHIIDLDMDKRSYYFVLSAWILSKSSGKDVAECVEQIFNMDAVLEY